MNIAALMTCHNRKATTLCCLESLMAAIQDSEKCEVKSEKLRWDLFLVDDGSADGTREAVQEWSNSATSHSSLLTTHLIAGNGNLYWARGMALAWREALKYEDSIHRQPQPSTSTFFSHFLWLNDDTVLRSDALSKALEAGRAAGTSAPTVVVGALENSRGEIVYGKRGDLFTGNFVLVPRSVCEKVGMICDSYRHAWADSDYALRCKRAGVPVVSCGVVGQCEGHPNRPSLVGISFGRRCRMLWDPKGWCVHDLWLYRRRNWGLCAAVFSCAHLIAHVILGER